MNLKKKAASIGLSATLLASLMATIAAPAALGAISVTNVGIVPVGTTSATAVSFTLAEEARAGFPFAAADFAVKPAVVITIVDNAGAATVTFDGTPVVSAPASTGASASTSANTLTVSIKNSDSANYETIVVSGLKIKAAAGAAIGPIKATIAPAGTSPANDLLFFNALFSTGAAAGDASGKLVTTVSGGATTFNVTVDNTSCPFNTKPDGANPDLGPIIVGSGTTLETLTSDTAGAVDAVTKQQVITLVVPTSLANTHLSGETVTQTNVTCGVPTPPFTIASPGTVGQKVTFKAVTSPLVRAGRNNEPAGNLTVAESAPSLIPTGTKLTFAITTTGVVFSTTPAVAVTTGDLALSTSTPPALSADRTTLTVTVAAASLAASTITISGIKYDLPTTVTAGTKVNVTLTLSNGLFVDSNPQSNATTSFAIVPTAAQPTVFIGFNGQNTGMITFTESGPGFFTDGTGSANKFWVCISDGAGETFTNAPWAIVSAGDLKLLAPDGTSATSVKGRPGGPAVIAGDISIVGCYYWSVYSKSTVASTVQIVGEAADGSALAAGANNGPQINVPNFAAPGTVQMTLHVGTIPTVNGAATADTPFGAVANAIRAFKSQLTIKALSAPSIMPGAIGAKAGNLQLTETQLGQLDRGAIVCVQVMPRTSSSVIQARTDVVLGALNTSDLPKIDTNGTQSGLLASQVDAVGEDCSRFIGDGAGLGISLTTTSTAFAFEITQGSVNTLGQITISNIKYTALSNAALGPVQVNVFIAEPGAGIQQSQGLVANAIIGSGQFLNQASAMGVTQSGAFTVTTKVSKVGQYITIRIQSTPALAGAHFGIWISKKGANGKWSAFSPHTGRVADGHGVVYYYYKAGSVAWLSFKAVFKGDGIRAAASAPAIQAKWTR